MVCKGEKCDCEKFTVIKCFRNKKRVNGKWVFSDTVDTRIIACNVCSRQYLTESVMISELVPHNYKRHERPLDNNSQTLYLFDL
jgi:hypothetical protein